jgi:hypothetical protein
MNRRSRASLAFHGSIVILLGLLAGFPYAFVISGDIEGEVRAWRMAHLEGVLNGLVLLGVGAAGSALELAERQTRLLITSLLVAGYGNVVAAVIGASFGVRGLTAAGPPSNFIVFALFTAAIIGVFLGLGLTVLGAFKSLRAGDRAA